MPVLIIILIAHMLRFFHSPDKFSKWCQSLQLQFSHGLGYFRIRTYSANKIEQVRFLE